MTVEARIPLASLLSADASEDSLAVTPGATRGDWLARVDDWHAAFRILPGDSVALHFEDSFEFSAALFAAWQADKTVWLPGDVLPPTLARLSQHASAFAGELPGAVRPGTGGGVRRVPDLDPARCRVVLFTSGSTGEPGAIVKTLRQLDDEVAALESCFGASMGGARVHGTVSHQHIYGLLFRILWPLSSRRAFAPRRLAYNEELTALGTDPVILVSSPAHLKRLPETQDWQRLSNALRLVFSSGGPLPADAAHDVKRLWGQAAVEVFGSTETGGIAWRRAGGAAAPWQPLPGVDWRIVDGMLHVRSPHLPDRRWLPTQDRARASGGGAFDLLGRADRIVKIEERRISVGAIERRLQASGLLREARVVALPGHRILLAVAAVPSDSGNERLQREGRIALAAELREWLAGHVDPIALPRRWRFLEQMPADARGKTSERTLAALFRPTMPEPGWLHRDPSKARVRMTVSPELAAFDGHFPQAAILPGVVLVDWAVRLGREAFGFDAGIQRMDALKFQHLVRPGMELVAELDWQPGQLAFRFESRHGVHASGRLRFSEGSRDD